MAADARRRDLEAVGAFAKNLGLAFQIEDDLLDVLATSEETGKDERPGRGQGDVRRSCSGSTGARALAAELLAFALASVAPLGTQGRGAAGAGEFVRDAGGRGARRPGRVGPARSVCSARLCGGG